MRGLYAQTFFTFWMAFVYIKKMAIPLPEHNGIVYNVSHKKVEKILERLKRGQIEIKTTVE